MAGAVIKSLLKESIKNLPEQGMKKEAVVPTLLKKGVKQEEIDFSGVVDNLPEGKLTKADLVEAEAKRKDKFYTTEAGDHYKHVSLPGGQNNPTYREKLINFRQMDSIEAETGQQWVDGSERSRYTSAHFPEEDNYLAHTRIYDEDMDGVPTRVLQEMQSDLHQQGRQSGYDTNIKQDIADQEGIELSELETMSPDDLMDTLGEENFNLYMSAPIDGVPQSPYEKTWLAKTIERELVDGINEGRAQLAIPIRGAGVDQLHRGEGVQKWYETQVLNTAKKVAKRAGADFELTGNSGQIPEGFEAALTKLKQAASRVVNNLDEDIHDELVSKADDAVDEIGEFLEDGIDSDIEWSQIARMNPSDLLDIPEGDTTYAIIKPKGKVIPGTKETTREEALLTIKTEMHEDTATEADFERLRQIKRERKGYFELDKPMTMNLYTTPTAGAFAAYTAYKAGYGQEEVNARLAEQGFDDEEIAEINQMAEKIAQASAQGYSPEEIQQFLKGKEIVPEVTQNNPKPVEPLVNSDKPKAEHYNAIVDEAVELEPKDLVRNLEVYLPTAVSTTGTLIPAFFGQEEAAQRLQLADQAAKTRIVSIAKDKFGIDLVRQPNPGTGDMGWFIQTENGLIDATPDALTEWTSIGAEVALGMTSAIAGGKLGASLTPPVLPIVGPLAKPLGFAVGAFTGGLLSDLAYQEINYLHSAMKLQEDMESATMKHLSLSAVENALIGEVIGYSAVKLGGATWNGIKRAKDFIFDGNSKGAYKALKETTFLDDSQLDEMVGQLENIMGKPLPGNKEQKAIQAYALTGQGSQDLVQATAGINAQATKSVAHSIDKRAKDVIKLSEELTDDKVPERFIKDLNNYTNDVKNFYNDVKMRAVQSPRANNFNWDYDSLAIEPVLGRLQSKITDPVTSEKFLLQAQRIRDLSESRSFGDLIELRQITNDFLYNKRVVKADDQSMLRGIVRDIDEAIVDGAPQVVDQPDKWLKDWSQARIKYTEMKSVQGKSIYNLVFDKKGNVKPVQPATIVKALGKYATALDGSFEEVMSKLPIKARSDYEQAVVDNYVKKFTITAKDGSQAINFPNLAEDLNSINLTAPNARRMKDVINEISEVFKNDAALSGISHSYDKIQINQGLSSDLQAKAKYTLMAKVWDEIQTTTAIGKVGREYSLIKHTSKLLEKPLDAKSAKELLEARPTDTALVKQVRELQQEAARAKAKGQDLTSPRVNLDAGGKLVKSGGTKTIPMHRIATEQQVKDIADANAMTVDSKTLNKVLKKYGYIAKMQGTDRVKMLGDK